MKRLLSLAIVLALIAAAYWAGSHRQPPGMSPHQADGTRKVLYYVDPMNPAHTSDKPGLAPCGMELQAVYADGLAGHQAATGQTPLPPGVVQVSPERQQLIGVRVAALEKTSGTRTVRTLGKVALDETRVFRVAAAVEGWIRTAGPIVSGSMVRKDEVLATFYNRDFLTAQQTYLYALNTMDRFKDSSEGAEQLKLTQAQIRAAEENLEFLGMGETQVHEIARTREIARNVELRSPVAGLVLARNAFPGLRFERGTEIFRVAELNHIWVLADVFENEGQDFRPGSVAWVKLRGEHQSFEAKVSDALPQFDPATRTMKVRLEADNPGRLLRPDMFVDVELTLSYPPTLTVPLDALLDSGLRKTVFVERAQGVFEPRAVQTGWRAGEQIEITGGLTPGERIVVAGNFLLDSESRMKLAAAGVPAVPLKPSSIAVSRGVTDPVCGMTLDEAEAKAAKRVVEYHGQTFGFCSDACKNRFEADPAKYLARAKAKAPSATMTAAAPRD